MMKVLVLGSGGREHALVKKLKESAEVFAWPGNPGIADEAQVLNIPSSDFSLVCSQLIPDVCLKLGIDLVVPGSERFIAEGLPDRLRGQGVRCFAPNKAGAKLESSKAYAKLVMDDFGIPTADFEIFYSFNNAFDYIKKIDFPYVIKANGLCGGKGVFLPESEDEAFYALQTILVDRHFGATASEAVVIEKRLFGKEASLMFICDGKTALPLVSALDYKRAFDGDRGPNTGGMGAISPNPYVTDELIQEVQEKVVDRLISGFTNQRIRYKGFLYVGLMLTDTGPKVLEFNVRLGDPEAQVVLSRMKTNLMDLIMAAEYGCLDGLSIHWSDKSSIYVVLANEDYPDAVKNPYFIHINNSSNNLYHSGTERTWLGQNRVKSGRVMGVLAQSVNPKEARKRVYKMAEKDVEFVGKRYRTDIGKVWED